MRVPVTIQATLALAIGPRMEGAIVMGTLKILPCVDSEAMAEVRRRELDMTQEKAAALGTSADGAARRGFYLTDDGNQVDWCDVVQAARDESQHRPDVSAAGRQVAGVPHHPGPSL